MSSKPVTIGVIAGLILIALGAWLATGRQKPDTASDQNGPHAETAAHER